MPESRGFHQKRLSIKDEVVRKKFLQALAETGLKNFASQACGVCPQQVLKYSKENPEFAEDIQEAIETYNDSLEMEAHRRAVDGWNEPVFSQKLGVQIGTIRKYSDKLLELKLKRHIPEYRQQRPDDSNVLAGVMVVGLVQNNTKDWIEQYQDKKVETLTFDDFKEVKPE